MIFFLQLKFLWEKQSILDYRVKLKVYLKMMTSNLNKAPRGADGFTLVELLVVIAIMGILSAMGFVGLQDAIENNKVKDASLNVTAFLERVANDANRRSEALCLKQNGNQKIEVYLGSTCTSPGDKVDEFVVESPMKFVSTCPDFECDSDEGCDNDWLSSSGTVGVFKPKLGLSAAPTSGYVCIQYGDKDHYAAAVKPKSKNSISATVCDEEGCEEL